MGVSGLAGDDGGVAELVFPWASCDSRSWIRFSSASRSSVMAFVFIPLRG